MKCLKRHGLFILYIILGANFIFKSVSEINSNLKIVEYGLVSRNGS